ncbi:MAG: hypothetical protein WCA35_16895 [Kovacikia sp.]
MSQGAFTISRYADDLGDLHPIRLQPETLAATINGAVNAAPSGALTPGADQVRARGSRRKIGKVARWVSFTFTGAVPTGYKAGTGGRIPVLVKATWDAAGIGQTGDYLGSPIQITGKGSEGGR